MCISCRQWYMARHCFETNTKRWKLLQLWNVSLSTHQPRGQNWGILLGGCAPTLVSSQDHPSHFCCHEWKGSKNTPRLLGGLQVHQYVAKTTYSPPSWENDPPAATWGMNASGFTVVGTNVIGLTFAVLHTMIVGTRHHPSLSKLKFV